jgi:3-oxoacyl-[acyl-carrier protein] reductase
MGAERAAERGEGSGLPLRRIGEMEDVANAVLFAASDRARHITGQVLSVNGGFAML